MKRSATLQPLSREHHAALKLAKFCQRAAVNVSQLSVCSGRVAREFLNELAPHFMVEERTLLPLLEASHPMLVERTLAEHRQLRELFQTLQHRGDVATLAQFGHQLAAHVRFEERELFPELEKLMQGSAE